MITFVVASAIHLASWQNAAAVNARNELLKCLRETATKAESQKMPADGFVAFAHANCSSQEQGLKAAIWAFDAKNKVSRKQSEEDANLQIEDYVLTAEDKYRARAPKPAAAASPQGNVSENPVQDQPSG